MKRLISPTGKPEFIADALVSTYLRKGYKEDIPTPPPIDPPENEATSDDAGEFVCPVCGKSYKTQAGLDKHMTEKHPEA